MTTITQEQYMQRAADRRTEAEQTVSPAARRVRPLAGRRGRARRGGRGQRRHAGPG